jgi:bifunctional non-homologous end joining protein LigD
MLAVAGALPTVETDWAYEPKWDGIRAIARVAGSLTAATSRNGQDLMTTFPEFAELHDLLGSTPAVLDGELVAIGDDGRPQFGLLQQRLNITSSSTVLRRAEQVPVTFVVFDLLHFDRHTLIDLTYDERRAALERLDLNGGAIITSHAFRDTPGKVLFEDARDRGLEGLVAKRRSSPYLPGKRSGHWLKVKAIRTQEVVICGWTAGQGQLKDVFGALMLGIPDTGGMRYVGKVGTGFDARSRTRILDQLRPLAIDRHPFTQEPEARERVGARYVKPALVGEVQFSEWTRDGRLRHPSWRGMRPDKSVDEVVRES